jgi:hypothetical protein
MASPARAEDSTLATSEQGREPTHSGRLLLRMPPSLHGELARAAEREGVSLNAYITAALSGTVGWRSSGAARGGLDGRVKTLLIADLVLVAIAALVAIALLLVAAF